MNPNVQQWKRDGVAWGEHIRDCAACIYAVKWQRLECVCDKGKALAVAVLSCGGSIEVPS